VPDSRRAIRPDLWSLLTLPNRLDNPGTFDLFMNSYLAPKISSFCVAHLRNSWLLRAIRALNLNTLEHKLLRSE
jgi:hypothetical protein